MARRGLSWHAIRQADKIDRGGAAFDKEIPCRCGDCPLDHTAALISMFCATGRTIFLTPCPALISTTTWTKPSSASFATSLDTALGSCCAAAASSEIEFKSFWRQDTQECFKLADADRHCMRHRCVPVDCACDFPSLLGTRIEHLKVVWCDLGLPAASHFYSPFTNRKAISRHSTSNLSLISCQDKSGSGVIAPM